MTVPDFNYQQQSGWNSGYRNKKLWLCVAGLLASDVSNPRNSVIIWKMKTVLLFKPSEPNDPVTERRIEDTDAQIRDF
jgi:hypothetical protein